MGSLPDAKTRPMHPEEDDARSIFDMMQSADSVIYVSPLYAWGFSSLMKAFPDRHHSLVFGFG